MTDLGEDFRERLEAYRTDSPVPSRWTPEHVASRMIEAYRTLTLLPMATRPKGMKTYWPAHDFDIMELDDVADRAEAIARKRQEFFAKMFAEDQADLPTAEETSRMEEALRWPMRFLGKGLSTRWAGKVELLADALTFWAECEARDDLFPLPRLKGQPRTYAMLGLAQRMKDARARADSMALKGEARTALYFDIKRRCEEEIAKDPRSTKTRRLRIVRRFKNQFRKLSRPEPHECAENRVITEIAMNKYRKRACEIIAARLKNVPVR
jgi:hypothetical protein